MKKNIFSAVILAATLSIAACGPMGTTTGSGTYVAGTVTTITVYATREGYDDSDVATATIGWRNGTPILEGFSSIKLEGIETNGDVNGDGTVDVADIATIISIMAGKTT